MNRSSILGLCVLNFFPSACGSAANREAMLQAAIVTAAVVGEAVAESAARDAEREQARRARAAARLAPTPWRLVRYEDADCENDSSDSDESEPDAVPSNHEDLPNGNEVTTGHCMVCN